MKRGPSNLMIAVAAIAAAAAIGLAVRSFFWKKTPTPDTRAAVQLATSQPSPVGTPAASPTPSISPGPEAEITPGDYRTYHNERFDYSILYPSNFLTERELSQDGAGQRFKSKDGRVEMRAYGGYNSLEKSLAEMYEEELKPNRTITYEVLKKKWFVISGYEGGKVFYQKTILKDDVIKTFHIEADRALQPIVQPMTEKIARSFK
ncbi:MAG: hypothetical protein ACREEM_03760 [Blastocatellia bacterium]